MLVIGLVLVLVLVLVLDWCWAMIGLVLVIQEAGSGTQEKDPHPYQPVARCHFDLRKAPAPHAASSLTHSFCYEAVKQVSVVPMVSVGEFDIRFSVRRSPDR
jgi:hypothetical protein